MALCGLRTLLGALALFWTAAAMGGRAEAATLYTYSFTQEFKIGSPGGAPIPTSLSGHFTGTADALGYINLSTLTDFHLEINSPHVPAEYPYLPATYSSLPDFFSFQVGDASGSTLAFKSPAIFLVFPIESRVCVGVAVAALCGGGTSRGVYQLYPYTTFLAGSEVAPVVTLVSSSSPVATTPIPGALFLFTTALGGAGALGALRRRASA
jgi:hypothetical protein